MPEQQTLPLAKPKRKSPESVRRLSPKEVFQLATLVAAEYALSEKNDDEFALYAIEKLSIPGINRNHVSTSREIHGIPALKWAKLTVAAHLAEKDEELYSRVLSLEKQVRKLFAMVGTMKVDPSYQHEEPTADEAQTCWNTLNKRDNTSSHSTLLYRFALAMARGEWK